MIYGKDDAGTETEQVPLYYSLLVCSCVRLNVLETAGL